MVKIIFGILIPCIAALYWSWSVRNVSNQTLLMFKPDGMAHKTKVLQELVHEQGFAIVAEQEVQMTSKMVRMWYEDLTDRDFYPSLEQYMTRGPCYAVILDRPQGNAIHTLRLLIGPTHPDIARQVAPHSIRARFGSSIQENAVHASDSSQALEREKSILFSHSPPSPKLHR